MPHISRLQQLSPHDTLLMYLRKNNKSTWEKASYALSVDVMTLKQTAERLSKIEGVNLKLTEQGMEYTPSHQAKNDLLSKIKRWMRVSVNATPSKQKGESTLSFLRRTLVYVKPIPKKDIDEEP